MSYNFVRLYHPELREGDIDVLLVHLPHPRDVRLWRSHYTLIAINNELRQHYYVQGAPGWAKSYRRQAEHWRSEDGNQSARATVTPSSGSIERALALAEVWQSRCQLDLPFPTGNVLHRRKD